MSSETKETEIADDSPGAKSSEPPLGTDLQDDPSTSEIGGAGDAPVQAPEGFLNTKSVIQDTIVKPEASSDKSSPKTLDDPVTKDSTSNQGLRSDDGFHSVNPSEEKNYETIDKTFEKGSGDTVIETSSPGARQSINEDTKGNPQHGSGDGLHVSNQSKEPHQIIDQVLDTDVGDDAQNVIPSSEKSFVEEDIANHISTNEVDSINQAEKEDDLVIDKILATNSGDTRDIISSSVDEKSIRDRTVDDLESSGNVVVQSSNKSEDQVDQSNIIHIDTKMMSNKLLEPVSRSASPKTPISADEFGSDDLVLKWDDDEESEGQSSGNEKPKINDDHHNSNMDVDFPENEEKNDKKNTSDDLIKQLDQQISELDNTASKKDDAESDHVDDSIDDQVNPTELFKNQDSKTDIQNKETLSYPKIPSPNSNTKQFKTDFENDIETNTSGVCVDNLIKTLDSVLNEEKETKVNEKSEKLQEGSAEKEAADTVISESVFLPEIGKSKANINENKKACVSDSEVSEAVLGNVIEEMDVEHNEKPFAENDGILDAKAVANSTAIEIDQEINKTSDNLSETLQSSDDTFIAPREHNLNKTDMMLEIPTQEIIDCLDESIEMSKVEEPVSMEVSETSETVSKNKVDEPVSMEVSDTSETVSKNKVDENITDDNNSLCSLPAENTNEIESQKDCQPTPQQIEIKTAEDSSQSEQEVVIETKISNINTNTEALQNEFKSNNFEIEKEIIAEPDTEVVGELEKELSETPTELKNADNSETRPIIEEHNETISDVSPSKADLTYEEETKVPESVTPKPKDQINEVDKELGKEKLSPKPVNQTIKDVISESDSQVPKIEDSLSTLAEQGTNVTDNIGEITHETDDKTGSNDVCTTDVSTTKEVTQIPSKSGVSAATPEEIQNNQMLADTSDEVLEVTDSLGLLAESSRVVEDDDDQETSDRDEGDDDDDFDPDDESSNQMTAAEMSEDSNLQAFESDLPKVKLLDDENAQDYLDKDLGTPPDGLSTLSEAINASDTAVLETDIEEPSIEDFINKVDEISEVDAEMLEDVEALSPIDAQSPSDIQSPAADELESDKEFNFSISNVVSETDGMKDAEKLTDVGDAKHNKAKLSKDSMGLEDNIDVNSTDAVLKSQTLITDEETKAAVESLTGESQTLEPVILKELLSKDLAPSKLPESPSKASKLEVSKPKNVISIVDLGESSSEDVKSTDVQETPQPTPGPSDVTMTSDATPVDTAKTSDPKIKSRSPAVESKDTDAKSNEAVKDTVVFNLDSDEEDRTAAPEPTPEPTHINKCINNSCTSDTSARFYAADRLAVSYYEPNRKRKGVVCEECAATVAERTQRLIDGVKNLTPLLDMDMGRPCQDLVEISDSDSDSEPDPAIEDQVLLGAKEATQVEERLVNMINETWEKFKMDSRLDDTQAELSAELERLDKESKEIDLMLRECQAATDKLRTELYATFEPEIKQLPGLIIFDTPDTVFTHPEKVEESQLKRRLSSSSEKPPSKRPSLSSTNIVQDAASKTPSQEIKDSTEAPDHKIDDDKDVSVVNLSAESAPPDLPPAGNVTRPPLRTGMAVYAMRNVFGSWLKGRVFEIMPRGSAVGSSVFTMCRIKFESKSHKNQYKMLPARCLAYSEPADVRMTIGTRLIALFKDPMGESKREAYYSGIVAEVPNPVNSYRYLVFFDDGYAQYVRHRDTRLVCECSLRVWEEVHPFSREFVRDYLTNYPERPMVRLHPGQKLKTEWNGKWWSSRVIKVDASLVQVHFENDNRTEWMYRGSTRLEPLYLELQNAERQRNRAMPRNRTQNKVNMPYVEYTRSDEATAKVDTAAQDQSRQEEARRAQRAVAKKSVGGLPPPPQPQPPAAPDTVTSRVVYYTPKNAVKPYKMVTHNCGPKCKRTDVLKLHELRTYNPLAKPLLSGWERQLVRYKGHKEVMYRAPCGRRLRNIRELHRYLRLIQSDMGVDLFDFSPNTHCLAEFVLNKCIIAKKDLSNGKENVPVPCVNYYDNSLPEFCSYNTERTPTDGVPLNLDPDFLCGCDCTDDCEDKSKCACWQLTLEGARTIGLSTRNVGYSYKRLPQPLPSGIYECNSRCKCKSTCLNRVAQHPLQLKLQVFKTLNRGWGIRALNDVPKGAFLCVYAGNLLTDATANLDGLNEGDEYLAELDYIEVVEQMKEGYEEDVPENDKKLDGKDQEDGESTEEESEEEAPSKNEKEDGDFEVPYMNVRSEFRKTLRKRDRKEKQDQKDGNGNEKTKDKDSAGKEGDEDCITISDDEEVREPSRFTAQAGMGSEFKSKYRSVRSYFGKDEACYIMDAKVQGNIGRYLNHSCSPNVFVQNVFVDTHDPRFPWVAFFALLPIRAGTELTWNYNYDVGSVPGKVLYCYCGAANCRGRLL